MAKKKEIIAAALDCYIQKGYTDTSMSDIAREAGASIGSVYHHFKNKEQLAAAAYIEVLRHYQEGFIAALKMSDDPEERIGMITRYHLTWVNENRKWARYLFINRYAGFMNEIEGTLSAMNNSFYRELYDWLDANVRTKCFRLYSAEVLLSLIMGPCHNYARYCLEEEKACDIRDTARIFSASAWHSIAVD